MLLSFVACAYSLFSLLILIEPAVIGMTIQSVWNLSPCSAIGVNYITFMADSHKETSNKQIVMQEILSAVVYIGWIVYFPAFEETYHLSFMLSTLRDPQG